MRPFSATSSGPTPTSTPTKTARTAEQENALIEPNCSAPARASRCAGRSTTRKNTSATQDLADQLDPEPVAVPVDVLDEHHGGHLGYFSSRSSSTAAKNADAVFRTTG